MKRKALWFAGLLLVLGVTVAADGFTRDKVRSDCSGRIVCSITGEETCKDQCPLVDASRSDCPGKVECPLTGEPVCRDECPLATSAESDITAEANVAACCVTSE